MSSDPFIAIPRGRRAHRFTRHLVAIGILLLTSPPAARGQDACTRIMKQDSTLNNLVDPPGYRTAAPGTLGAVLRMGTGTQPMILVPGFGFGGVVFTEFMERFAGRYRMYAVTLPGFGGTPAPPAPAPDVSFGDQTWTNNAVAAIEKLIEDEDLQDPVVVGHWVGGTQIALRLSLKHPDRIKAVVLLAGVTRMEVIDSAYAAFYATPERRVASVDKFLAQRWFKTVTRETWDDNNFLPGDYATNPVRALRLWREAASPQLHVWVRYLCEFNAQDISVELGRVSVPTLLLEPGLEGNWHAPSQDYMRAYCHASWQGRIEKHPKFRLNRIPDSRACLWFDQPEKVEQAITEFLGSLR